MNSLYLCTTNSLTSPTFVPIVHISEEIGKQRKSSSFTLKAAAKSGALVASKSCAKCKGQGAIECPGCKGSGKNKKNGNIFERWKCFECQGFGLKSCPVCGKGGLTPEQRGER